MDISLCCINRVAGKLEFAGANNPLYIVRDGTLTSIKADKMPIGFYFTPGVSFTNNETELKKEDCLYLFSDGYADQFGGPDGKKFMNRRFEELLLEISGQPMQNQKELLIERLNIWKGDNDQVDDILVIGIKV